MQSGVTPNIDRADAPGIGAPDGSALYVSTENGFFDLQVSVSGYITVS
jgi:hypothetical protein